MQYLLDLIPPIKSRSFSISSSPLVHKGEIHLTVAIVDYKTKLSERRVGVCTNWMKNWKIDGMSSPLICLKDKVSFKIQKGSFKLPENLLTPIICIGPGTGIAPMRSLLWTRFYDSAPEQLLFFGCRSKNHDFYYANEWESQQAKGSLYLYTAFSRDQAHKIYVQDLIKSNSQIVWSFISRSAIIYLSG